MIKKPLRLALLGSTGSIGLQALDLVRKNPHDVQVVAIAAHSNLERLRAQAAEFGVRHLALGKSELKNTAKATDLPSNAHIGFGADAVLALTMLEDVDVVLNAMVGAAGLRASYATLKNKRRLALANKESLVVGGDLIMPLATKDTLLPVDSEHSAIYQCLLGENQGELSKIWLTASGGPFRGFTRGALREVVAKDALAHPTWAMGSKITIDSSTLMNKGLEAIEAHHLFSLPYEKIKIVVHPQSCIHSMVEYIDGSVKAHLGATDMRIPIQYALSYPARWRAPIQALDFCQLGNLTFEPPDLQTFGALRLALDAGRVGGTMPAVLNAANEVVVAAFLNGQCAFLDIEHVLEQVLERHKTEPVSSLEQLEEADGWARAQAAKCLN